jgi:NTE family protein
MASDGVSKPRDRQHRRRAASTVTTRREYPSAAMLLCAALALLAPAVSPADPTQPPGSTRPRIGLVLSGGGARGTAHVGVLQVLEEHRIPIDCIAGTSMGSLVGGLYASGLSPAQLDSVVTTTDWSQAFADNIPRGDRSFRRKRDDDLYLVKHKPGLRGLSPVLPPGILDGYRIDLLLKRLSLPVTTVRDFDRLRIPYRAVAADIVTGERVVLDHGDLALAMRSSMAIPGAFAPREIDGHLLVDGGIVDNFPIGLTRTLGADVLIAVDIATPPAGRDQLYSVPAITAQLATLASEQEKNRQVATLGPDDVLIRPPLGDITVASFDRAAEAVGIGRRAAEAVLDRLDRLAVSPEEYTAYRAARAARGPAGGPPRVDAVRIVNRSRLADAVIADRLRIATGQPLDVDRLEQGLARIYGLELFESVYYDIAPTPQGNTMTVTARERAWGPNYLQGGVAVLEDFEHPNFNVALAYSRTAVDRLNGEWRTGAQVGQEPGAWTEFYQPLDTGLRTFGHLELRAGERSLNQFTPRGRKRSEIALRRYGATLAGGREIGTWGEVRAGLLRESGRIRVLVGDPGFAVGHYALGEAFAQFAVDKLDEIAFPHHGGSLRTRYTAGLGGLGSGTDYRQWDVEGAAAATRGRSTGVIGGLFGMTERGDAPLARRYVLGGLGQLSGLQQDERIGPHALMLRGMLYHRIGHLEVLPVYAGLSGEYGAVFRTRASIELKDAVPAGCAFLGFDTLFGPLCIAYGRAEGGRGNYYFTLGQPLGGHRAGSRVY